MTKMNRDILAVICGLGGLAGIAIIFGFVGRLAFALSGTVPVMGFAGLLAQVGVGFACTVLLVFISALVISMAYDLGSAMLAARIEKAEAVDREVAAIEAELDKELSA